MGFVFFLGGTIILSIVLDVKNEMRLYKDMADLGYKLNSKKYTEVQKKMVPDAAKVNILSLFIPIYNIFTVYKRTLQYNDIRSVAYDQLNVLGVLDEMSDLEKKEYAKKPTGFRAVFSPLIVEMRLMGADKISFNEGDIYYKLVKKGKSKIDIKIVDTTVDTEKVSLNEQKEMIKDARKILKEHSNLLPFIDTAIKGTAIYGQEEFFRKIKNNEPINLDTPVDEESLSPERKEEIIRLRMVKAYLLSVKGEKDEVAEVEEKRQSVLKKQ